MTSPTRRISFYLKPAAVKSEQEACIIPDNLSAWNAAAHNARPFWRDWNSHKTCPALRIRCCEWSEDEIRMPSLPVQPENRRNQQQPAPLAQQVKEYLYVFPE